MSARVQQGLCDRACAWAALVPDGELAQLEQRLLGEHLAHCAACSSFAAAVAATAVELRDAAPETPARVFVVPAGDVRRSVYARLRAVGAVAAVAAMAFGIASRAPLAPGGDRGEARPTAAPAEVAAAELHAIRRLRRESLLTSESYPDRPARAFGNQPA